MKSQVISARGASLLGFWFFVSCGKYRIGIAPKSIERLKTRIREHTSRIDRQAMADRIKRLDRYLAGQMGYFALTEAPSVFAKLDSQIRHRLRQVRWVE